jgi:hypothetical protein
MAEGAIVTDRPTKEIIVIVVSLVLGISIIIVLTAICYIEITDYERDTSTMAKYLSTILSSLAFGLAGYLLGYHRNGKDKEI